jgi:hypothetical protein
VPAKSQFSKEVRQAAWLDGIVGGKLIEEGGHSDIIPALRYLIIAAKPFLPEADERTPEQVARDAAEQARKERLRAAEKRAKKLQPSTLTSTDEDGDDWSAFEEEESQGEQEDAWG